MIGRHRVALRATACLVMAVAVAGCSASAEPLATVRATPTPTVPADTSALTICAATATLMEAHNGHVSVIASHLDTDYQPNAADREHLVTAMLLVDRDADSLSGLTFEGDPALLVALKSAYLSYMDGLVKLRPIVEGTATDIYARLEALGPLKEGKEALDAAIDHLNLLEAAGTVDCSKAPRAAPVSVPQAAAKPRTTPTPAPTPTQEPRAEVRRGAVSLTVIDGDLYIAAEVRNVGTVAVAVEDVQPYTVTAGGKVVASGSFIMPIPQVIGPGQSAHMVAISFGVPSGKAMRIRFDPEAVPTDATTIPRLRTSHVGVRGVMSGFATEIKGIVENRGDRASAWPVIGTLYLDAAGRVFAGDINNTGLLDIPAGKKRSFEITSYALAGPVLSRARSKRVVVFDYDMKRTMTAP